MTDANIRLRAETFEGLHSRIIRLKQRISIGGSASSPIARLLAVADNAISAVRNDGGDNEQTREGGYRYLQGVLLATTLVQDTLDADDTKIYDLVREALSTLQSVLLCDSVDSLKANKGAGVLIAAELETILKGVNA